MLRIMRMLILMDQKVENCNFQLIDLNMRNDQTCAFRVLAERLQAGFSGLVVMPRAGPGQIAAQGKMSCATLRSYK
jgi:hypothetical protein